MPRLLPLSSSQVTGSPASDAAPYCGKVTPLGQKEQIEIGGFVGLRVGKRVGLGVLGGGVGKRVGLGVVGAGVLTVAVVAVVVVVVCCGVSAAGSSDEGAVGAGTGSGAGTSSDESYRTPLPGLPIPLITVSWFNDMIASYNSPFFIA